MKTGSSNMATGSRMSWKEGFLERVMMPKVSRKSYLERKDKKGKNYTLLSQDSMPLKPTETNLGVLGSTS